MSIFERVRRCVAEIYDEPLEQITAETRFADLDNDSLEAVELMMTLEEEFDLDIPDDKVNALFDKHLTVGQLAEWVEQHL